MAGPTDMVGQLFIIASDKTQIEVGETVHFSISYDENRTPENDIDIYINNDFLESIPVTPSPVLFNYTFEEDGIFYLYATTVGTPESNTIAINVDEATPQTQSNSVSWIINNKTVSSLEMNNKEIQSIVTSDNVVLYNINSPEYDAISLSSDKNILSYADSESCTLSAQLTNNQSSVAIEGEIVTFTIYDTNDDIMTSLIGITDSTGLADVSYSSYGIGDIYVKASVGNIVSSEVYIEDIYWYSDDGTKLYGTYSTDSDSSYSYITNIETNVEFPHIPTGNFELSMKAYRPTITTYRALLIEFGASKSDTLLCGWDDGNTSTTKNCRIYRRIGSINASVQNNTNPQYNNEEWVDFKLRFEEGTVTLTIGGTSISTIISSVSRIGNYSPTSSKLSEFKIKLLTKTFDGVSLTSDKSILSYSDSDSCTLSAQLTDSGSPVSKSGVSVEFFNGSTSLGSALTDSNGIATKVYSSTGEGDVVFTAISGNIYSTNVNVEDCIRYDNATSDKTSNYSTHNLNPLTFNSDHYEAYRSVGTSLTSTFYSPVYIDDTLPQNFEMSVMYNSSKMNTEQIEFIIAPNHPQTYSGTTELGIIVTDARRGLFHRVNGSATWYTESSTLSNNVWYTFYLKIEETTVTAKILDENNNTIYTSTQTISTAQNYKKWSMINGGNSRTLYFKNLKIKPL